MRLLGGDDHIAQALLRGELGQAEARQNPNEAQREQTDARTP
jgi:hypothetical protein